MVAWWVTRSELRRLFRLMRQIEETSPGGQLSQLLGDLQEEAHHLSYRSEELLGAAHARMKMGHEDYETFHLRIKYLRGSIRLSFNRALAKKIKCLSKREDLLKIA